MKKIDELKARQQRLDEKLDSLRQTKSNNGPTKEAVFGTPAVRRGENALSSRGFQFQRLLGVLTKTLQPEQAKVELELCERLRQANLSAGFGATKGAVSAPLSTDLMGGDSVDDNFRHEIKSLVSAGVGGYDHDEASWIARKSYREGKANQSWIDETLGGALVAPPEFGELIQLLRNKDALINAGARVVPLPPSGRIKFPRQTSPTSGYWVGENSSITSSNFGTGSLLLSAKKVAAIVTLPNELIRFASPASEAILRADMTKTLSLTMDYYLLYGEGSDNVPQGLVNVPNIATVTPSTTGNDGNTLSPQDLYLFPSAVEANNAEFQGWILRPELFFKFASTRATTYSGSGQVGQFDYDQFRPLGGSPMQKIMLGYPAVTSAQVSITRAKGNASNLTSVFGGQWDDFIVAMFGSIEFAEATQGETAFANDQTVVRAILTCDGAPRHPGAFAVADQLIQSVGN